jgi:hypothetical protein
MHGRKNSDFACSFCGHTQEEVERLVAGQEPGVFICNDCVKLCGDLLKEEEEVEEEKEAAEEEKEQRKIDLFAGFGKSDSFAYFGEAGEANTEQTIKLAAQRCRELRLKHVVVATSTGETAIKVAKEFKDQDVTIIAVTLHAGTWKKYAPPDPKKVKKAEEMGVKFLTCTHALMGNVGTGIMRKFGGINWTDLIAHTYYTFSQGTKVAVEIAVMAADAGLIPVDKEIISIAGTDTGADTALVIKPAYCTEFFDLRVREIIAKPR